MSGQGWIVACSCQGRRQCLTELDMLVTLPARLSISLTSSIRPKHSECINMGAFKYTSLILRATRTRRLSTSPTLLAKNRIFNNIRTPDELQTLLLVSSSNNKSLITLWTAGWCAPCKTITPLIRSLVEEEGAGEQDGGISFAEVELDAPTIGDLPITYAVNSVPTLLAFARQRPQLETRVTGDKLRDKAFLKEWIAAEARRGRDLGPDASGGSGLGFLGKWFAPWTKGS